MKFYCKYDEKLVPLETIDLKPNDIIKIDIDMEQWSCHEAHEIFRHIGEFFPNNKVLCLLNGVEVNIAYEPENSI